MKKIYFLGLMMGCYVMADAQTPKTAGTPTALPASKMTQDYVPASPVKVQHTPNRTYGKTSNYDFVKVGETMNDRQANSSVYRRIMTYPGNKISIIWQTSHDGPDVGYLSRGTGYNHFDGTAWGPIDNQHQRLEPYRAGYPCLDYSSVMDKEVIFSHRVDTNGKSGGMINNKNLGIGSTVWSSEIVLDTPSLTQYPSVLWPRIAISGNYIHVIGNYTTPVASQPDTVFVNGVKNPTVYSRFNIATNQWETRNIALPGYDNTRWYQGSGDGYSIDVQGSTVAILMGGLTNDMTLWKSTDDGHTWTQKIIDSFPYPAYNNSPFTDTLSVCDGTMNVKLDGNGNAHCFWGRLRIVWNNTGNALGLFLSTNAITYWNEANPSVIMEQIAYAPDEDGDNAFNPQTIDSRSRYTNSGSATMPYATTDKDGRLFVVYSALSETDGDGAGALFRHIYCVYSEDTGATWSAPVKLTFGISEQMYTCVAQNAQDKLQMTYMQSDVVGVYDATDNPNKVGPFDMMYLEVPISSILDGTVGVSEAKNEVFTIGQNYPNPADGITTIPVNLKRNADVTINIVNVVGQTVYNHTYAKSTAGVNNIPVDLSNLNSGVYFYTVEAEGFKVTNRMIVE